jgi:tetratricopeptide (TPR) repeat protein
MLVDKPDRAASLAVVIKNEVPFLTANFAARVALIMAEQSTEPVTKVLFLNSASGYLAQLGRREEALATAENAVDWDRKMAAVIPEFTPRLAGSLHSLVSALMGLGRWEEAVAAAQEAVDLYREQARIQPDASTPNLAGSLANLAAPLSKLGRLEEAVAAAQEAADLYRELAQAQPEAFMPDLVWSLFNLGLMLTAVGRHVDAADCTHEGLMTIAPLVEGNPEAFRDVAGALFHSYLEACEKADVTLDSYLLFQITEAFVPR